jgi:hypothetical protein
MLVFRDAEVREGDVDYGLLDLLRIKGDGDEQIAGDRRGWGWNERLGHLVK